MLIYQFYRYFVTSIFEISIIPFMTCKSLNREPNCILYIDVCISIITQDKQLENTDEGIQLLEIRFRETSNPTSQQVIRPIEVNIDANMINVCLHNPSISVRQCVKEFCRVCIKQNDATSISLPKCTSITTTTILTLLSSAICIKFKIHLDLSCSRIKHFLLETVNNNHNNHI